MTETDHRRTTSERAGLSRDVVVTAALRLIDDQGVDALTMRALARHLGVYPTALYWHAGSKAELIAAAAELAVSEVVLPPVEDRPWQEWLRTAAHLKRESVRRHPNIYAIISTEIQVMPVSFSGAESTLHCLSKIGFRGPHLRDAYNFVYGAVFAFAHEEHSLEPSGAQFGWKDLYQQRLDDVDADLFPHVAEALPWLRGQALMFRWERATFRPFDSSFEFMLDTAIAGLEAQAKKLGGAD